MRDALLLLGLGALGVMLWQRAASASPGSRPPSSPPRECPTLPSDLSVWRGRDDLLAAWQWIMVGGQYGTRDDYETITRRLEQIGADYEALQIARAARMQGYQIYARCEVAR